MECSEVRKKLSLYIDQMLDENSLELVDAHLSHCAQCRAELSSLESMVSLTAEIDDVEVPAGVRSEIMAAIKNAEKEAACCSEIADMLSAYVDHELEASQEIRVREHLATCDECLSLVSDLRAIASTANSIEAIEPPMGLREKIAEATTRKKSIHLTLNELLEQIRYNSALRWAGGAMAAGLITFGVLAGMSNPQNQVRQAKVEQSKPISIAAKVKPAEPEKREIASLPVEAKPQAHEETAIASSIHLHQNIRVHKETVAYLPAEKPEVVVAKKPSIKKTVKTALNTVSNKPTAKSKPVSTSVRQTEVASVPEVTTPVQEVKPEPVVNEKPKLIKVAAAPSIDMSDTKEMINKLKSEASMRRNSGNGGITIVSGKF